MPELWGEHLTREALRSRVGHLGQVGGVRRMRFAEGVSEGVEVIEVDTAAGLTFDVLPSRGLDLGMARWQGRPLAWLSTTGFVHPAYGEERGHDGWVRSFGGGLLTTCGLLNAGEPGLVDGHAHGLHGRASITPAYEVAANGTWVGDTYTLGVRGKTREAALFGDKLEKTRIITAALGEGNVRLTDVVENIGSRPAPLALLYHINLGWPLVGPHATLNLPSLGTEAVQGHAEGWEELPAPDAEFEPCVIEHRLSRMQDGSAALSLTTPDIHCSLTLSATLTRLTQWRCFRAGDYVLGLEPGNVGVRGRVWEEAHGTLPVLEPGETRKFWVEFALAKSTSRLLKGSHAAV